MPGTGSRAGQGAHVHGGGAEGASVTAVSSPTVTFGDINITNPTPEAASTSIAHSVQRAAWLAGREIV